MKPNFIDLDEKALDELIARVSESKEHNLALSPEDNQLLLDALLTLVHLQEKLTDKDITLHKLRKLLGLVKRSEKLSDLLGSRSNQKNASSSKKKKSKKSDKPKNPVKPEVKKHALTGLNKVEACPACDIGKLYKYEPACLLRITGNSPFTPVKRLCERLRCNACGQYFQADLPQEVMADGAADHKHGYSARSLMAINKYYSGLPYSRQESLQDLLGVSIECLDNL